MLILGTTVIPAASAQAGLESEETRTTPVRYASGTYANKSLGLEIDLPEGWTGAEAEFDTIHAH